MLREAKKNLNLECMPSETVLQKWGTFSDKQKLRELVVSKPVLEEMLNEVLQQDLHKEKRAGRRYKVKQKLLLFLSVINKQQFLQNYNWNNDACLCINMHMNAYA